MEAVQNTMRVQKDDVILEAVICSSAKSEGQARIANHVIFRYMLLAAEGTRRIGLG